MSAELPSLPPTSNSKNGSRDRSALEVPQLSLVVLIGPSGSGKSTFAARHFKPTEIVSSDTCRGLVSDDFNDQSATNDAFALLSYIAAKRLARGRLTVVDATNVKAEDRRPLVALAREYHALPVAIVFDLPERFCHERNRARTDRDFGEHVIRHQRSQLRRGLRGLKREGFRHVFEFQTPEAVDAATIVRTPLWCDRRNETGPFDIIGDVHGCFDELVTLLTQLGYQVKPVERADGRGYDVTPPPGRRVVFVGDLVDRGPRVPDVLRLAMDMTAAGHALAVPGNHDIKLMRKLRGRDVRVAHGLEESLTQLAAELPDFSRRVADFIDDLVSHYVFDDGRLVVAHAGMKADMQGRGSGVVREFALYGETTGETDEFGLPVRHNWAAEYRGRAIVVYGHTPTPEAEWLNHTINIDTGCVFGGKLTALRYPEKELVSVPALRTYAEPARPFLPAEAAAEPVSAQQRQDDVLDMADVSGKRIIHTRLTGNVTIGAAHATAALETISRFAINPKWLIYLPPTMSPCETSLRPGLLEHPDEAFAYFQNQGVPRVVCEEKHMGSRAVIVVCRDQETARRRFGVATDVRGIIYTRTGRQFFDDAAIEGEILQRIVTAATQAGLWDELKTDWLCLDCELMPWSAKAQSLLQEQYAAVGAAAGAALPQVVASLDAAAASGADVGELRARFQLLHASALKFTDAYRRYCWPVHEVTDYKIAPFHLLACESGVFIQRDHDWHMQTLARLCAADPQLLLATPYRVVDVSDDTDRAEAVRWWEDLTARGGEGMVVKPLEFVARGPRGMVQPAIKCRGCEYLRIIYGPNYDVTENIERLRSRGLGMKRSLALREFSMGIEALERFVRREPLRRVHECVFGVLALESEPVDPRL